MTTPNLFRCAAVLAFSLAASAALANPSVAPGLWEYRSAMKTNDPAMQQAMAEAQKALASMPPEQRRQMVAPAPASACASRPSRLRARNFRRPTTSARTASPAARPTR
jgi:hypothetical protein